MVNQILDIWDSSNNEDRQQMAHMLFEYLVYDLDQQRIVDFRLKAWAERYLVLHTNLYGYDDESSPSGGPSSGTGCDEMALSEERKASTVSHPVSPFASVSKSAISSTKHNLYRVQSGQLPERQGLFSALYCNVALTIIFATAKIVFYMVDGRYQLCYPDHITLWPDIAKNSQRPLILQPSKG